MAMIDFDSQFHAGPTEALSDAGAYDAAYRLDLLDGDRVDGVALDKAGRELDKADAAHKAMTEALAALGGDRGYITAVLSDLFAECGIDTAREAIDIAGEF